MKRIVFDWDLIEFRIVLKFIDFNRTGFLTKDDMPVIVLIPIVLKDSILRR